MKNKRLENFLYNRYIGFIIIFVIMLSYCYTKNFPLLDTIISQVTLLFCILIIVFYLLNFEISKISLYFILYLAMLMVSTLLGKNSSLYLLFTQYYRIVAIFFYLDYGLKYYCKNIVNSFYWALSLLVLINFYTLIKFPNGLYASRNHSKNWFFNNYNSHILTFLPTLMFMFIKNKLLDIKLTIYDLSIISIITYCVFKCFSATSVVAYSVLLLYLLFSKYIDKFDIFNIKNYFLIYIAIFFGIIIFRLQNLFSFLIVDILGKNLTFTNRVTVWDNTMNLIKTNWFLGFGKQESLLVTKILGNRYFSHAHNTILDVIYKGGIISLILHFIMLFLPIKELYKYRKNKFAKFISIILFCFLIMMNFEARNEQIGLYIVLVSCYNINYILKNIPKQKEVD